MKIDLLILDEAITRAKETIPFVINARTIMESLKKIKYERKAQNAKNSAAKRLKNPNANKGGRPKLRNDELIKKLRKQGLSIRAIAKQTGISAKAVQRGLR
jgi:DNA invertase Pin-like site-specific DNA recombinase